jgi:hypothetical protein
MQVEQVDNMDHTLAIHMKLSLNLNLIWMKKMS